MTIKILLIDRKPEGLDEVEKILQLQDFETLSATDGRVGLQLALEQAPSLIICNLRLPKLEGDAVFNELQQHEITNRIPFIFLAEQADAEMALDKDVYLMKPVTQTKLLEAVHQALWCDRGAAWTEEFPHPYIQHLERQVSHYQELADLYLLLLQKFSQDSRHPISNLYTMLQLWAEDDGSGVESDRAILEDECERAIAHL